jgi:TetR/AcrR family transcriptional repressor of nem operon
MLLSTPLSARVHQVVGGEGLERRAQLVRAAFDRVAEVGFEGLRLRQVADDVGIDHSTLHHHFATKQDLIGAVADYATRQFWVLGESVPDDPVDALRAHLAGLGQLINDWPGLLVVTAELDLRARRDPVIAEALDRQQAGWREALMLMLNKGNAGGAWAVDAAACTELVIAAVKGVRLAPDLAGPAFAQLEQLIIGDPS